MSVPPNLHPIQKPKMETLRQKQAKASFPKDFNCVGLTSKPDALNSPHSLLTPN